jgi:hypothetical protein
VPAAAVTPAPAVYINTAAVKKPVVYVGCGGGRSVLFLTVGGVRTCPYQTRCSLAVGSGGVSMNNGASHVGEGQVFYSALR